ncbi:hypothetical protein [Sphingobacterium composti Ten et al. 2007 non Yoo et al. 2007]|uniref:hypothetical protein n=1 Tax=Sphingobacterium composti TaxID=363260 RepID=UPI00135C4DBE|nr:hypothetical protein [Sphingobacterium composti Ten et al. 2007 non Yoo et al. 2007]
MAQERFYYSSKSSPLISADESIVNQILTMYEDGTSVGLIKETFPDIKINNNLYMFLPYVITDDICDCGKPLYRKTKGRTSFAAELIYCPACRHDETPDCLCKTCILKRKNELEARKMHFYKTWDSYYDNTYNSDIELSNLSIYEEVQLVILIHEYFNKESKSFNFINARLIEVNFGVRQLPTEIFKFTKAFIDKKILIPEKEVEYSTSLDHYGDLGLFQPQLTLANCQWTLNLAKDGTTLTVGEIFNYLVKKDYTAAQREILWKECYQESIINYFEYSTRNYANFDLIKQNLELIADELFNHYSLSKSYRLIYYGIQRTLTHKAKYSTTIKSANSYLRNLMLSNIEKYNLPEHKPNLKDFNPVELSESYFTHYIKRYILRSNQEYFYYNLADIRHKF